MVQQNDFNFTEAEQIVSIGIRYKRVGKMMLFNYHEFITILGILGPRISLKYNITRKKIPNDSFDLNNIIIQEIIKCLISATVKEYYLKQDFNIFVALFLLNLYKNKDLSTCHEIRLIAINFISKYFMEMAYSSSSYCF